MSSTGLRNLLFCRSAARAERSNCERLYKKPVVDNLTATDCSEDDDERKRKLSEDICAGCSDVDYVEDRGDRSACCKPCPSPVPSDDCFDPCKTSSPSRRGGRSPRDHDCGGSDRGRRSRKSHRSASEICDECLSMSSPSTRRRRSDNLYDDMSCCPPPRDPCCPEPRHDHHKASYRRTKNDDSGGTRRGSVSLSPCGGRESSDCGERRSERTAHVSHSHQSHKRDDAFHHDTRDDSSLERTTTRTRTGCPCPQPEERDCESESRSLFSKCSFL